MTRGTCDRSRVVGALMCAVALLAVAALTSRDRVIAVANGTCRSTVVFWAWERAEDLRFLDGRCTAVAWFGGRLDIDAANLRIRPREQTLQIQSGEANWPVLRVDAHGDPPSGENDPMRRAEFVRAMRRFLNSDQLARGLQIDFDAPRSWRPFYRDLLGDVRSAMPPGAPLTITALASWCLGDPWIAGTAAVTDAIPMLFRMGGDAAGIRRQLAAGATFRAPQCRPNVGVSIDEPIPQGPVRSASRVYVFAPRAWTPELVDRAYVLTGISRSQRSEDERP